MSLVFELVLEKYRAHLKLYKSNNWKIFKNFVSIFSVTYPLL